ncbi:hypothetical protein FGIG_11906 [Fasciola gigantica]|uniref:Uncharacterized protein n=1 Tax=Fasciola gigantica TaxID=46835 RepID=A0A504Z0B6_FASGI|nr:hypothetical protein FGIG_11906 [Fasciola gigantica]
MPRPLNTSVRVRVISVDVEVPHTFMGFIPIRLIGPRGSKETYAFLCNSSNSTLLIIVAIKSLGIEGPATRLRMTSLGRTTTKVTSVANFAVHSLNADYQIQVERADNQADITFKESLVTTLINYANDCKALDSYWDLSFTGRPRNPSCRSRMCLTSKKGDTHWSWLLPQQSPPLDGLISYCSSWIKLRRACPWLARFQNYIRVKSSGTPKEF